MRSLIGIDLNGANDRLAKLEEDGIKLEGVGKEILPDPIDLGIRGSMIRLHMLQDRWSAGIQNEFAPHGRGPAWGPIGSRENRIDILEMLEIIRKSEADERIKKAVTTSLPDLIGENELAVFAVPDIPAYGEDFRDRYLRLLNLVPGLHPLLLWRPVAALLGYITHSRQKVRPNENVAILSLMMDGIHLSLLSLEQDDALLVPQRISSGQRICASFRGGKLVEDARDRLAKKSSLSVEEIEASAISPWRHALGKKPQSELVRVTDKRRWLRLPSLNVHAPVPEENDLSKEVIELVESSKAQILLVEGPFSENEKWCNNVISTLGAFLNLPDSIERLDKSTVALGCMEAARRHKRGQQIYFDYLPQLRINAMVGNEPKFVDLIREGERCRGGEPFRADAPGEYVIDQGANRLTFWMFKENKVRKAEQELPVKANSRHALTVSVKQTPGQGFAEVQISSSDFETLRRSPIILDWASMEETNRSETEILSELKNQAQNEHSWPDTDVKPGHPLLWLENHPRGCLVEQLTEYCVTPLMQDYGVDETVLERLKTLRDRFGIPDTPYKTGPKMNLYIKERGRFRVLDSNGELPQSMRNLVIPRHAEQELDKALSKCENDFEDLYHHYDEHIPQDILGYMFGFTSWCFWRCPSRIADVFLDVYEGVSSFNIQSTLLRQGVARVISSQHQIKRYFGSLEKRLDNPGRLTEAEYAGLARLLGTSEKAAVILGATLADRIRDETVHEIADQNILDIGSAYKRRFKSALLMLAVLLRHRESRSNFLDPSAGEVKQLLFELDMAKSRNRIFSKKNRQNANRARGKNRMKYISAANRFDSNAKIIIELVEYIHFKGRDPNIIRRIDMLDED